MSVPEALYRIRNSVYLLLQLLGRCTAKRPPEQIMHTAPAWIMGEANCESRDYVRFAQKVLDGNAPVFGLAHGSASPKPNWNRDPLTGTVAPLSFGKFIDVRTAAVVGDIKYLWEPNRHLELVAIAQAYTITKEFIYLEGIRSRLCSWLDQCPYMMGPNWASGLESAIRLINWSLTWQLIGAERSPIFDGDEGKQFQERWLQSIYQHVHFVRNPYSRFSSANNHLIGEAAGVFIAACTWPYWEDFKKWGEEARCILIDAANTQIHSDGVNREQAISYQQFVLDFLILSGLAGRACDREFPGEYWRSIEHMIDYIHAIMDVGGNVPMVGDADDGFVTRLSQESDFCPYRSLLATGAILFDRADFAAKSGGLDDKTRILLGDDGWADLSPRGCEVVGNSRRQFHDGGYYILGDNLDTENEIRLLVDAGPLGYLSIAAHGHADALAVCLSVAGREFLVDPGTYTYHGKPEWRSYFRGSRAHNTVTVDGQDQSVQGGNFMWTHHANAKCTEFTTGIDRDTFVGEHDGFARLRDPVIHERSILRAVDFIEITDTLKCQGSHSVERCWHFSEQCNINVSGNRVYAEVDGIKICLSANNPMTKTVCLHGSDSPIGGWVSRRFDVKLVSTSVYFIDEIKGTTSVTASIQCLVE